MNSDEGFSERGAPSWSNATEQCHCWSFNPDRNDVAESRARALRLRKSCRAILERLHDTENDHLTVPLSIAALAQLIASLSSGQSSVSYAGRRCFPTLTGVPSRRETRPRYRPAGASTTETTNSCGLPSLHFIGVQNAPLSQFPHSCRTKKYAFSDCRQPRCAGHPQFLRNRSSKPTPAAC